MRFYRLLLRLYPSSFRGDYENELAEVFAERTRGFGAIRIVLAAIADVAPNAIASHWDLLTQDLRFAVRSMLRSPGFAITAILVTALSVGANTSTFSLADFVLVRPLPFRQADRIVKLYMALPGGGYNELSPAIVRDLREQSRSFREIGAYTSGEMNLVGAGEPRRIASVLATPEVLSVLGVPAMMGRHFTKDDATRGNPAILSHSLWQTQFGSDPNILGRGLRLNGVPYTVIGVMPATFQFPNRNAEMWTPLVVSQEDMEDRNNTYLAGIGRLRDGVTIEQARADMEVIARRMEQQYPKDHVDLGILIMKMRDEIGGRARMLVLALCGAALCILLLSCANLASLFLARGAHRARELAVRSALGAGRQRLVRQLITESFTIALAGGLVGVLVAVVSVPLLARLVPNSLPVAEYPTVDLRLLAFAAGFIMLTGVAFGVLPALRAGRGDFDALRSGARTGGGQTQRLRGILVVVEVIASVVLLIGAGLLIRAVRDLQAREPGFRPENVLTLRTALPLPKYNEVAKRQQFYTQVLNDVRALPGVTSAAFVSGLPMVMRGGIWSVSLNGEEVHDGSQDIGLRFVTPQFFNALGTPIRRGRDVTESDGQKSPFVAVVSESFVKQYWPLQDPIGKRFKVANAERTIVGVVGDVRVRGLETQSEPQVYLPYQQVEDGGLIGYVPKEMVVRATTTTQSLIGPITRIVHRADPEQPVSNVRSLAEVLSGETTPRVTQVRLLGALAAIALLIAGIGIHGLLTYTVSRRLPELGVRRALGAEVSGIVALVVREGIVLASIGIVIGAIVAWVAARGMGTLLAGIRPADPLTFAAASLLCFVTVLVGCLRAAMRAANVDPMIALRAE